MLTPEYLAATPDALVELYGKIEQDILANMAERIAKYDYYIPAVQHQHQRLRAMGMLETEIEQQLAALTGKTQAELKKLMAQAVDEALTSDAKIYAAAGMGDVDPLAVAGVREALQSGLRQTSGIFRNLTRTTANTAAKQFEDALDRAWLQVTSGAFDYNTAIRNAVKDLARTGVQSITYPSSHVDTIETAVRRAVVTGVNQTAAKSQLALMDELDIDLVEVTARVTKNGKGKSIAARALTRSIKTSRMLRGTVPATAFAAGTVITAFSRMLRARLGPTRKRSSRTTPRRILPTTASS